MKVAHVLIQGFVQGIGFRQFILRHAQDLRLKGWVRNLEDGRVEAMFQSSTGSDQEAKEKIEEMIKLCRRGPFLAEVENVEVTWEEAEAELEGFEIVI